MASRVLTGTAFTLPVLGLSFSMLCAACVVSTAPPPMSLARFARDPGGESAGGKVAVGTGLLIYGTQDDEDEDDDFNSIFYFFPVEGALSFWLDDMYDLSLSFHSGMTGGLEGNLVLVNNEQFRLGIMHGLALGFGGDMIGYEGKWLGGLWADFSAGLFFQVNRGADGAFFAGAKYTYALFEPLGGEDDPDMQEPESWTHYVSWSLGYMVVSGGLRITPEFIFSYGDWNRELTYGPDTFKSDADIWIILPSLSFAAAY
jgi:hypothetical protein